MDLVDDLDFVHDVGEVFEGNVALDLAEWELEEEPIHWWIIL